jgi:hypothetical protein
MSEPLALIALSMIASVIVISIVSKKVWCSELAIFLISMGALGIFIALLAYMYTPGW